MEYKCEETSATSPTAHKRPMTKGLKDGVSLWVGSLFSLAYPWFRLFYG